MNSLHRLERKRRKKILGITFIIAGAFVIIALLMIPVHKKNEKIKNIYIEAVTLVEEGNYSKAYDIINTISGSNYQDTTALLYLCQSHLLYEQGDALNAYKEIEKVAFKYQSEEMLEEIENYRKALKEEFGQNPEEDIPSGNTEKVEERKEREEIKIRTDVKTAEEEFAYTDAEELSEQNKQRNQQ